MSDFSLTLVLQIKTSKIINDMAKVQQKSEKISAFGGIFFVLDKFDRILSSVIDSHLGLRSRLIGYQYSEIIRAVFSVFCCGGRLYGRPQPVSEVHSYGASPHPCSKCRHSAARHRGTGNGITGSLLIIFRSLISLCFITCLIRISFNLKKDQKTPWALDTNISLPP